MANAAQKWNISLLHYLCDNIIIPKIRSHLPLSKAGGAVMVLAGDKLPKVMRERDCFVFGDADKVGREDR